jgi:hypothetical protein
VAPFTEKFEAAAEMFPVRAAGFLFVLLDTAPPQLQDTDLIEFMHRIILISSRVACLLIEAGDAQRSLDLWAAVINYSPVFFEGDFQESSGFLLSVFLQCAPAYPAGSEVLREVLDELAELVAESPLVDLRIEILRVSVAVLDQIWNHTIYHVVRKLATPLGDLAFQFLLGQMQEMPNLGAAIAFAHFDLCPELIGQLCQFVLTSADLSPTHLVVFIDRIGLQAREHHQLWLEFVLFHLHECPCMTLSLLSKLLTQSHEFCAQIPLEALNVILSMLHGASGQLILRVVDVFTALFQPQALSDEVFEAIGIASLGFFSSSLQTVDPFCIGDACRFLSTLANQIRTDNADLRNQLFAHFGELAESHGIILTFSDS